MECFDIGITRKPETSWQIYITCTKDKVPSMLDLKNLFGVEISSFVDFLQESVEEDSEGNEEDLGGPISGCKIKNDTGYGGIGILTTAQNRHYATTCYHVCYKNDDFRQTRDQNKKHKILLEDYNIHNSQGCQGVTCRYKKDERPFGEFYCGLYADEHDIALIQLKPDLDCSTMPKFLEGKNIRLTWLIKRRLETSSGPMENGLYK